MNEWQSNMNTNGNTVAADDKKATESKGAASRPREGDVVAAASLVLLAFFFSSPCIGVKLRRWRWRTDQNRMTSYTGAIGRAGIIAASYSFAHTLKEPATAKKMETAPRRRPQQRHTQKNQAGNESNTGGEPCYSWRNSGKQTVKEQAKANQQQQQQQLAGNPLTGRCRILYREIHAEGDSLRFSLFACASIASSVKRSKASQRLLCVACLLGKPIDQQSKMSDPNSGGGADAGASGGGGGPPRKEIYTYTAPWTVFAMAWSRRCVVRACFFLLISCCLLCFRLSCILMFDVEGMLLVSDRRRSILRGGPANRPTD